MSKIKLLPNDQVNWERCAYYYDDNGQAHAKHLEWGDDYTLEDGSAMDDMDAISEGFILGDADDYEMNQEEWN